MATPFQSVQSSGIPIVGISACKAIIRDADLFFCCGTDPAATMIRLVTGSPLSHTGFLFRDGDGNLRTIESTFTEGVHIGWADGYLRNGDGPFIVARLAGMNTGLESALLDSARKLLGRRYEVTEELEMAMAKIAPFIRVKPQWSDLFCSGMVEDAINSTPQAPWKVPNDRTGGNSTPIDIWSLPFVSAICAVMKGNS